MAAQVVQSLLMKKLGSEFVKAHEEFKNVKPEPKGELPGGIKNGIARLVNCKIVEIAKGKTNEGQLMFYASGSVVLPLEHDGIPIKGLFTQIMEPIFATPTRTRKTVAEHIKWVYSELASLGLSLGALKPDTIEQAMDALRKNPPYFRFRTWTPPKATTGKYAGKETMTMHFWDGKVEYKPDTATDKKNAVADTSTIVEPPIPDSLPDEHTEAPDKDTDTKVTQPSGDIDPDMIDRGDIDSLAMLADGNNDLVAGQSLIDQALSVGITKKQTDDATSFKQIAELIKAAKNPSQNGDSGSIEIGIGEHWKFYPPDPKTKEKSKDAITGEIIHIDGDNGTVNLKNIANTKFVYRNVPVDQLEKIS